MNKIKPEQEFRGEGIFHYFCPGCKGEHSVFTKEPNGNGAKWTWNGSLDKPTFNPSLLTTWKQSEGKGDGICHSYIIDGKIQFLSDCTHELAGQTVELPNI